MKVLAFLGSTRDGRHGLKVAKYVVSVITSKGHTATLIDPLEVDLPVLRQALHFMPDKSLAPESMQQLNKQIQEADAYIIITPEYNCNLPPALTNLIDHFPPSSFRHKPCSIVTYSLGDLGGARVAALALPFISEMGMLPLPSRTIIPTVHKKFDEKDEPTDERLIKSVEKVVSEIIWFGEAISVKREKDNFPV